METVTEKLKHRVIMLLMSRGLVQSGRVIIDLTFHLRLPSLVAMKAVAVAPVPHLIQERPFQPIIHLIARPGDMARLERRWASSAPVPFPRPAEPPALSACARVPGNEAISRTRLASEPSSSSPRTGRADAARALTLRADAT